MSKSVIVRDPVWGNIECPAYIRDVMDTEDFQRLDHVLQMGFTSLVFPGAVHTRKSHSLGVYHLGTRALRQLRRLPADVRIAIGQADERCFLVAALLHDVGHYPFSHSLEELDSFEADHEQAAVDRIGQGQIAKVLRQHRIDGEKVCRILTGKGSTKVEQILHDVLDGPIDIDKCDNLRRDSYFCGVPYGVVDVDRLIDSLRPNKAKDGIAIYEKGIGPVESLIFGHYLMFRHVYWHHAVRIAYAILKRAALNKELKPAAVAKLDDAQATQLFRGDPLFDALLTRRLHKRGRSVFEANVKFQRLLALVDNDETRVAAEKELLRQAEAKLHLDLTDGDILIDVPDPKRRLEVQKLDGLEVFYEESPTGRNPMGFSDPRVSPIPSALKTTFQENVRVVRVVCKSQRKKDEDALVGFLRTEVDDDRLVKVLRMSHDVGQRRNRC